MAGHPYMQQTGTNETRIRRPLPWRRLVASVAIVGALAGNASAARAPMSEETAAIKQAVRSHVADGAAPGVRVEFDRIVVSTVPLPDRAHFARAVLDGTVNGQPLDRADVILWDKVDAWTVVSGPGTDEVGCDIPPSKLSGEKERAAVLRDLGLPVRLCG
jgi:hypothetical protein